MAPTVASRSRRLDRGMDAIRVWITSYRRSGLAAETPGATPGNLGRTARNDRPTLRRNQLAKGLAGRAQLKPDELATALRPGEGARPRDSRITSRAVCQ